MKWWRGAISAQGNPGMGLLDAVYVKDLYLELRERALRAILKIE